MSSQQFPRHGMPVSTGVPQIPGVGNLVPVNQPNQGTESPHILKSLSRLCVPAAQGHRSYVVFPPLAGGDLESNRDGDHAPQDHPPVGGGGTLAFRDDHQETVVVRPYPQQPQAPPQPIPIQPGTPVTVSAAPVHLPQGQPTTLSEGQVKVGNTMAGHLSTSVGGLRNQPVGVLEQDAP